MSEIKTAQPAAVSSAIKSPELLSGWAERAAGNCIDTGRLLAFGMTPQAWSEFMQLQGAAVQRLLALQQAWFQGCAAWNRERAALKGANTVSKLVEQEFNIVAQLCLLMADQTTDLIALLENIDVSYAYWLSGKLGPFSHSSWRKLASADVDTN